MQGSRCARSRFQPGAFRSSPRVSFLATRGVLFSLATAGRPGWSISAEWLPMRSVRPGSEPPVIQGTGGLRKIRFAPSRWNTGKRGAVRVCYVYLQEYWTVLLVFAYGKHEKLDLTEDEKSGIKEYIRLSKQYLNRKNYA